MSIRYPGTIINRVMLASDVEARYPRGTLARKYSDTSGGTLPPVLGTVQSVGWATGWTVTGRMILPSHGRPRGVIYALHGAGNDDRIILSHAFGIYPGRIADDLQVAVLSVKCGTQSVGNPIAMTAVDFLHEWQLADPLDVGLGFEKAGLWSHSMGAYTGLNWSARNPDKVIYRIMGSPALDLEHDSRVGWTTPPEAIPGPTDADWGLGDAGDPDIARAAISGAHLIPDTELAGDLAWSGPGLYDQVSYDRDVVGQGYSDINRHPENFADGIPTWIFRSHDDHNSTLTYWWVGQVNSPNVVFRQPLITFPGNGHTLPTMGTVDPSTDKPRNITGPALLAQGGLAVEEMVAAIAARNVYADEEEPPEDVWLIPDEYADTTGTNYVEALLNTWFATVPPDGAIVRGKAGATYRVGDGVDIVDRDLDIDFQGATIYCPKTDTHPGSDRNLLEFIGGNCILRNVTVQGANTVAGHFDISRENQSGIKTRGVESFLADNVECKETWGDGITMAHDLRNGGSVPSRNVRVLPNCTMTRIGRYGVVCVSAVDYEVSYTIDGYGYLAGGAEPNGGNTRSVRGKWHGITVTPPPANPVVDTDIELGTFQFGGNGQEITDTEFYDITMTRHGNTNHAPLRITGGSPVNNFKVGWLTDDGTDDGRGLTLRTLNAVADIENIESGFRMVGVESIVTNLSQSNKGTAVVTRGGRAMTDGIVEFNTFKGHTKVIKEGSMLDGDRVRFNRFDDTDPYDQPASDTKRIAFAHTPDPLTQTRARIDAGWATGAAMYGDTSSGDLWDYGMVQPILDEFEPDGIDLYMMPKNVTGASVQDIIDNTTQAQRDRMWLCIGQEYEDDSDKQTAPQRQAVRQKIQEVIAVARPAGILVGMHFQTWTTYPSNGNSWGGSVNGPLTIASMMPQAGDSFGSEPLDFVGCTMIDHNQNNNSAAQLTPFIAAVRAAQPGVPIHVTNCSWGVPPGASSGVLADRDAAYLVALQQIQTRLGPNSYIGVFDFGPSGPGSDGYDYRVSPYPTYEQLLVDFADRVIP